jgi:signal transduction histidine kinase
MRFLSLYGLATLVTGAVFLLSYRLLDVGTPSLNGNLAEILLKIFLAMLVLIAIGVWWIVLSHESEDLARSELVNSLHHLELTRKDLIESEKMASLGGLVAGVAHEINTPLGIMVSAASYLRDKVQGMRRLLLSGGLDRREIESFVGNAEQSTRLLLSNADRAATLIQSFKKMAVDQTTDERREFDLRDYIEEIFLSLQPKLKKLPHNMVVDCIPGIVVDSYPGPFAQVLTNLAMNSLLHAYDEGQTGTIRLSAWVTVEDWIELHFSDDGKGIAANTLPKVFEPFFTTRRSEGGSGLGLHLAYNIVTRKLGGSMEARSVEGEGTTLVVRMPRVLPLSPPALAQAAQSAGE